MRVPQENRKGLATHQFAEICLSTGVNTESKQKSKIFLPFIEAVGKKPHPECIPYIGSLFTHALWNVWAFSSFADPDPYVLGLLDPDPLVKQNSEVRIRIRILLSSSKNSKKNLDYCWFMTTL